MKVRVKNIIEGKVTSTNDITGLRTIKDLDRLKGPGMTTDVIIKLKQKGNVSIEMPDRSTMTMILMND